LRNHYLPLRLVLLLAIALCLGCTSGSNVPNLGLVEGIVTLDGKPLANAFVVFNPVKGKRSTGQTDAQGHYFLIYLRETKGAIVGNHSVSILTQSEFNPEELVPPVYNHRTILSADVEVGENSFDFDLKSHFQSKR